MPMEGAEILWSGKRGFVLCDDPLDRGFFIIWWPDLIGQRGEYTGLEHEIVRMSCIFAPSPLSTKEF